ncbi:cytochrome c [Terasakiella sp. A23]|uniref:c-type cytochrome n=1 Tax=Terasakiella sp. FCG-A23 TaxID=3080561 RepID=UPI002952CEC5|nr:cytochrome c [Terasakiella sp. A23]MDV7340217.1 cytochrome c [Terasakiella sp. A23]
MKRMIKMALLGGLLVSAAAPALADKAAEDKIKARQGYYQLVKSNAGPLFGMAKGDIEYDAKVAATAANNLKTLSVLDNGHLWIPGTSKEEMPGKTRALKKIWDTYPAIGDKIGGFKKAVDALAANAGNGLDALRANVGPLGGACKACHDEFRADKF